MNECDKGESRYDCVFIWEVHLLVIVMRVTINMLYFVCFSVFCFFQKVHRRVIVMRLSHVEVFLFLFVCASICLFERKWCLIPWFSNWMNILLNWREPNSNFWIEFSGKQGYWIIFWIEYSWKNGCWIILWFEFYREMNEWFIFWIDICHFWWEVPFFVCFKHSLGNFWALFLFDQYQWFPDYWIESAEFCLNRIIFWIESWVKQ